MEINEHDIPSKGKVNAALTTGIIGTALGGLNMLGGKGLIGGLLGGSNTSNSVNSTTCSGVTDADLWMERKECKDYLTLTKQYYEQQLHFLEDHPFQNAYEEYTPKANNQVRFRTAF